MALWGYLRGNECRRVRMATACGIVAGLALAALAAPSLAIALTATSPSVLTALPGARFSDADSASDVAALSLPPLPFANELGAAGSALFESASQVSASDVAIPFDGGYYWVGDYMFIDGWVTNDTAAPVGPILLHFVVRTLSDAPVAEDTGAAAIYNLPAGEDASFKHVFYLPSHAGSEMSVMVETLAYQPSNYPTAVDLTLVDRSMVTDADGVRKWTCYFRNDSATAVKAPIVGGWEFDSEGLVTGSLLGVQTTTELPPGGIVAIEAYGSNLGGTPVSVMIYSQAIPVPVKSLDPIYRFYNLRNSTHFYTASAEERDIVISRWPHVYRYEGVAYYTNPANNSQPLFRFYYRKTGSHFYTASVAEANLIRSKWPDIFTYEGLTYSVSSAPIPDAVTVYRFINRKNSSHFYTASVEERDTLRARWSSLYLYEGPAFWLGQ